MFERNLGWRGKVWLMSAEHVVWCSQKCCSGGVSAILSVMAECNFALCSHWYPLHAEVLLPWSLQNIWNHSLTRYFRKIHRSPGRWWLESMSSYKDCYFLSGSRKWNNLGDQILVLAEPEEVLVLPLCKSIVSHLYRDVDWSKIPEKHYYGKLKLWFEFQWLPIGLWTH